MTNKLQFGYPKYSIDRLLDYRLHCLKTIFVSIEHICCRSKWRTRYLKLLTCRYHLRLNILDSMLCILLRLSWIDYKVRELRSKLLFSWNGSLGNIQYIDSWPKFYSHSSLRLWSDLIRRWHRLMQWDCWSLRWNCWTRGRHVPKLWQVKE